MTSWRALNKHPLQMTAEEKRVQYTSWKTAYGYEVTSELIADALADMKWRQQNPYAEPTVGLWWDDLVHCGICGIKNDLVLDHCHTTQLCRGYLCRSCNVQEGRSDDARFQLWRVSAPMLEKGRRGIYAGSGRHYAPTGALADWEFLNLLNYRSWWDEEIFWIKEWERARAVARLLRDARQEQNIK